MVVAALMQLAVAAPIGALFGAAYGTSIRIGYEIIFPALFGDKATSQSVDSVLNKMTTTFTAIGGLEAQKFGINQGIKSALKSIDADPELQELIKKNSFNDTLTITVNKSGNLENLSSVPFQSSRSRRDELKELQEKEAWIEELTRNVKVSADFERAIAFVASFQEEEFIQKYNKGFFRGQPSKQIADARIRDIKKSFRKFTKVQTKSQKARIARGQEGRKISQKVQRIPFTSGQVRVFKRYQIVVNQVNNKTNELKKIPSGSRNYRRINSQLKASKVQLNISVARIKQAKSVNLKGFELYYKWLAT